MTVRDCLFGIPLSDATLDNSSQELIRLAGSGSGLAVRLVNVYSLTLALENPDYFSLMTGPGINYVDGTPLTWAARLLGAKIGLTRGPSLFGEVLDKGREINLRHAFLGGSESLLTDLVQAVERRFPAIVVCAAISPPFRDLTDREIADQDAALLASKPDIVWVGLGTPRQDFEAARLAHEHGLLTVGVGAAFDFTAGHKRQAPSFLHHTGLEWAFRLATEPRRLWRRYLWYNARFVFLVLRSRVGSERGRGMHTRFVSSTGGRRKLKLRASRVPRNGARLNE